MDSFREKNIALASIHLKMQTHWFNGVRMLDSEGEELAMKLIEALEERARDHFGEDSKQLTSVPYYDIAYESIFPDLEEQEGSKIEKVASRLHLLKDLFGLKHLRSIQDIKNQSFFTLQGVFPELNRKVAASEAKAVDYSTFVKEQRKFVLQEPSRIICDRDAKKVAATHADQELLAELPENAHLAAGVRPVRRRHVAHLVGQLHQSHQAGPII